MCPEVVSARRIWINFGTNGGIDREVADGGTASSMEGSCEYIE
jgi:hypothetical protein